MLKNLFKSLSTTKVLVTVIVIITTTTIMLYQINKSQRKAIDALEETNLQQKATINKTINTVNESTNKLNLINDKYSKIETEYKNRITALLMENKKYEEITQNLESYTTITNTDFNDILSSISYATGFRSK